MKSFLKMVNRLTLVLLIIRAQICLSQMPVQEIVPPSPDAAQLGVFGTVTVGLHTGTMQQSIPIYEYKTANLSLPITLSYSSNGLVVDKVASWVGFDWSLEAGGVITVSVKGQQDNQHSGRAIVPDGIPGSHEELYNFLLGQSTYDYQPDVYSFNFGGYSGKFILNVDGLTAITIPYQKLKIETSRSDSNMIFGEDFIITTPDGIKYKFTVPELYFCFSCDNNAVYPTSWYLTSIIHPAGDTINLYYMQPYWADYYSGVSQQISRAVVSPFGISCEATSYPTCPNPDPSAIGIGNHNEITYLDSIRATNYGTVIFQKSDGRSDYVDGRKLDRIIVKNYKNEVLKVFDFKYHFQAKSTSYPSGSFGGINITGNHTTELNYRMFLDSVIFKFPNYNRIEKYSFGYKNISNLPARLSFAQDHWGYFNGRFNNFFVPAGFIPTQYISFFPETFANREPDGLYSQNGMLNKITYPTGGYSTIDYEPQHDGTNQIGGCRVKKVSTYENASAVPVVKRYYYNTRDNTTQSQGQTQGLPTYYKSYVRYYACVLGAYSGCLYAGILSNSQTSLYQNEQNPIIYPNVTISNGGENFESGGEGYSFYVSFDAPGTPVNTLGGMIFPIPFSNNGWFSGAKLSESVFRKNSSGQFLNVKYTSYSYTTDDTRNSTQYPCLAIINRTDERPPNFSEGWTDLYLQFWDVVGYNLYSFWQQPTTTTVTDYDDLGNAITSVTTYYYENPTHTLLSRETTTNSKGNTILKKYYYPHDYNTGVQNFETLKTNFIINKPIDTRTYTNSKLTLLEQYKYNNVGQPTDYYKADISASTSDIVFSTASPYTASHKFALAYNTDYKLKSTTPEYDITTSYIWGYNNTLPVVKIQGIAYANIPSSVITNISNRNFSTSTINTVYKADIDFLKTQLSTLMSDSRYMVSFYTYSPLIGMTSQTDTNGKTTYYEYDNFGRLKNVLDQDQIVIQQYRYHYKP